MSRLTSPQFLFWSNVALVIVWCLLVIPTILLWRESIFWVSFMSIYAIIVSHATAIISAVAAMKAEG